MTALYKVTAELAYPYLGITDDHLDYFEGVFDGFRPTVTDSPQGRAHIHLLIQGNTENWAATLGKKLFDTSIPRQLGTALTITTSHATATDLPPRT